MKKKKLLVSLLCATAALGVVGTTTSCTSGGNENPPVVEDVKYTVTFNSNGGSAVTALEIVEGNKITKPTNPTKEGYTFVGWYKDSALTQAWNFDTDTVTTNLTLYAKWKENSQTETKVTVTFNTNGGSSITAVEVTSGSKISQPENPTKEKQVFTGWFKDEACTEVWNFDTDTVTSATTIYAGWRNYQATLVYNNNTENEILTSVEEDGNYYVSKPEDPTKPYSQFIGWYTDAELTTEFDFINTALTSDITIYAKWDQKFDTVNTIFDFEACALEMGLANKQKTTVEYTYKNKFYFGVGVYFEYGSDPSKNCINTQAKDFVVTVSGQGATNSISFNAKEASSRPATFQFVNVETEEIVYEKQIAAGDQWSDTISNLEAGQYKLVCNNSIRFYSFAVTEKLPQSATTHIELNTSGIVKNYLLGQEFDASGLAVNLAYENGRLDLLDPSKYNITVDDSFTTSAGVKTIKVTYQYNADTVYTEEFTVNVCEVESLVLYQHTLNASRQTINNQVIFNVNGTFNYDSLVVKAKCKIPGTDEYVEFLLSDKEYVVSNVDLTTTGNKSVTITYGTGETAVTADYDIEVLNIPDLSAETAVNVTVNPTASISVADGVYNFHTINQALQFLTLAKVSDNCAKTITLTKETVYNEKVYINIPNVTLTTADVTAEDVTKYGVIEFNVLAGMLDPSETTVYSTDGSATVTISKDAEGFTAKFVTFKNYYNTYELYSQSKTMFNDTQAVAALVQADKSTFINCYFTSYHDTLYAQVGRQYYENCIIEGHTDYIFGYDATAYFKNSTIKSIGAGIDDNNGGYVVASKGNPVNGENIIYGYIFDGCTFTADENTASGSVSLARGWNTGMTMMIMNSTLTGHFSKEAYGYSESKFNDRYGKMNAEPVAEQLLEYNNTGDGAITESIANTCTVVDEATAAKYADLVKVFTPYNGTTTYNDAWAGTVAKDATITIKNADGSDIEVYENISYIGSYITNKQIEDITSKITAPSGKVFVGLYTDAQFTTEFTSETILTANNVVYAKFESAAPTETISYDERLENGTEGWTVTMNEAGSSKIGNDEGISHTDADPNKLVSCDKLQANGIDNLTSATFTATNSVVVNILGGTTSTSKAVDVLIEALDADGKVVASTTGASSTGKVTGYITVDSNKDIVLTSDAKDIVTIRISCTTSGKNICVVAANVTYETSDASVEKETIANYDERLDNGTEGWTVTMNEAGSSKIGNAEGVTHDSKNTQYDASKVISCDKLQANGIDNLTSATFTATNSIVVNILGGTTSTTKAVDVLIEALDADGKVVASTTATSSTEKATGYATVNGNKDIVLTSESNDIVKIRISCTTDTRNICILACTVKR